MDDLSWLTYLRNVEKLHSMPAYLKNPELEDAFRLLEKNSWGVKELDRYERSLDYIRSDAGRFDAGKEEGIAIGKEEGIIIGKEEGERNITLAMLNYLDINTVAQITKLSVDEIKKLKTDIE